MAFTRLQVNRTLPSPTGASRDYVFHPYLQPPSPNFSILVVAIIGIVTTAFLLLSYYVFVIKFRLNWHHLSHRFRRFRSFRHFSGLENYHEQPVLYTINNGGLEQCAIQSIPVILFKKTDSCLPVDVNDCAVCLNQFDEGERLRNLPICSHSFHIDCIDTWLQSHANCPVCRSSVSNTSVSHQYVIEIENPFAETHLGLHSNSENGFPGNVFPRETHDPSQSMEMSVQVDQAVQSTAADRNARTQKLVESSRFFEVKFRNRKSEAGTKKIHHKHRLSGSGDECVNVRHRHDDEFSIEPIRRSFSMDSCADVQLYISLAEILEQNPHLKRVGTSEHKAKRNFSPLNKGELVETPLFQSQ